MIIYNTLKLIGLVLAMILIPLMVFTIVLGVNDIETKEVVKENCLTTKQYPCG